MSVNDGYGRCKLKLRFPCCFKTESAGIQRNFRKFSNLRQFNLQLNFGITFALTKLIRVTKRAPMAPLKDFSWWPSAWCDERGGSAPLAEEINKNGVLKNVRPQPGGLTLVVDQNGVIYTAKIASNLSDDFLILLRHMLLQQWGQPIEVVENIDIGFGQLT